MQHALSGCESFACSMLILCETRWSQPAGATRARHRQGATSRMQVLTTATILALVSPHFSRAIFAQTF